MFHVKHDEVQVRRSWAKFSHATDSTAFDRVIGSNACEPPLWGFAAVEGHTPQLNLRRAFISDSALRHEPHVSRETLLPMERNRSVLALVPGHRRLPLFAAPPLGSNGTTHTEASKRSGTGSSVSENVTAYLCAMHGRTMAAGSDVSDHKRLKTMTLCRLTAIASIAPGDHREVCAPHSGAGVISHPAAVSDGVQPLSTIKWSNDGRL